ncbi:hypothetical protein BDQ17DRAFT_1235618, partial [Cyathus striatus]
IILRNIPKTAMPADVRRAIFREEVKDVINVELDYQRFRPSGRAVITLSKYDRLKENIEHLRNVTISGIQANPSTTKSKAIPAAPSRSRGVAGRAEAAERGVLLGNGPSAGLSGTEKMVTIWGAPGRTEPRDLAKLLINYKVVKSTKAKPDIHKIPLPDGEFSMHSRFIVKLESESEAHRLVRDLHRTRWVLAGLSRSIIHARVIY